MFCYFYEDYGDNYSVRIEVENPTERFIAEYGGGYICLTYQYKSNLSFLIKPSKSERFPDKIVLYFPVFYKARDNYYYLRNRTVEEPIETFRHELYPTTIEEYTGQQIGATLSLNTNYVYIGKRFSSSWISGFIIDTIYLEDGAYKFTSAGRYYYYYYYFDNNERKGYGADINIYRIDDIVNLSYDNALIININNPMNTPFNYEVLIDDNVIQTFVSDKDGKIETDIQGTEDYIVKVTNINQWNYIPIVKQLNVVTEHIEIYFYNNVSENEYVNKELLNETVFYCLFKNSSSIISPTLLIQNFNGFNFNYCYIPIFGRYYYITNITTQRNNLWEIETEVDVLMSFKDTLYEQEGLVGRNEFNFDNFIPDKLVPCKNEYNTEIIQCDWLRGYGYGYPLERCSGSCSYVVTIASGIEPAPSQIYNGVQKELMPNMSLSRCNIPFYCDFWGLQSFMREVLNPTFWDSLTSMFANKSDFIVEIKSVPFNLWKDDTYENERTRFCGTLTAPLDSRHSIALSSTANIQIEDGSLITMQGSAVYDFYSTLDFSGLNLKNSFLDYKPYKKIDLYVPFVGFIDFPVEYAYNDFKYLRYSLNSATGDFICYLSKDNGETRISKISNFIELFNGNMYTNLGFGSTNASQIHLNNTMRAINLAMDLGTGFVGGAGTISKGASMLTPKTGVLSKAGKRTIQQGQREIISSTKESLFNAVSPDIISENTPTYSGSKSEGSTLNYVSFRPFFRVTTMYTYYPDNYAHFFGRPLMQTRTLKDIHGFTQIASIHLNNFYNATQDELSELEGLLYSGIILP